MLRGLLDRMFGKKEPPDAFLAKLLVRRSPPSTREGVFTPEQQHVLASVRTHEDLDAALPAASGVFRADLLALHGDLHWKEKKPAAALEYWQVASDMVPTDLSLLANLAEAHCALGDAVSLARVATTWHQLGGDPGDARAFEQLVAQVASLADPLPGAAHAPKPTPKGRTTLR